MALLDSEIARIKWHLGYNVLSVGAEPYVGYASLFDQVIKPYVAAATKTTSSTAVVEASPAAAVTITVASAAGFEVGERCIVDVDSLAERATIRSVAGTTIGLVLALGHTGTYPVMLEGPEAIVRDVLGRCEAAWLQGLEAMSSAGLEQLGKGGEIRWFPESKGGPIAGANAALAVARHELASMLGVHQRNGGGSSLIAECY